MEANNMDRGSNAMKSHLSSIENISIRQTRKGWCMELMGCEANDEFKYFIGDNQVFKSVDESGCFCRLCCATIHPYETVVKEVGTNEEILTIDRPLRCKAGPCKCCCFQEATISSNGAELGRAKENCWYCVPSMKVYDHTGKQLYLVHPPTCCGGVLVNCCAEGNPCGKGCCKSSFRFYSPEDKNTGAKDAPYLGHILKKPKSMAVEIFTDAVALDTHFPNDATPDQKGLLTGLTIFINSIFYENQDE